MKTPTPPQYLIRFDDICPTMQWDIWEKIEAHLIDLEIKPILAIVPDNQDPKLKVEAPHPLFWERARAWQARGWTIGLHGYQHRYVSPHSGLVALRKKSEFAGLPRPVQSEKLRQAAAIFMREKLKPMVWIAPGNTFDATTVSLLPTIGIRVIVDGYFSVPYVCGKGITWVPQQLFGFRPIRRGVWTVCYHHNDWTPQDLDTFFAATALYRNQIHSLEDVLSLYQGRSSAWSRHICTRPKLSRLLARAQLKLWSWLAPAPVPSPTMTANTQAG